MMNGSARKRPPSAPIFIIVMKPSVGAVYINFVPPGISSRSGSRMASWIWVTKMNETRQPADEGVDAADQALPELVEMLQKRHLAAGAIVVLQFVVVRIARDRSGGGKRDEGHTA